MSDVVILAGLVVASAEVQRRIIWDSDRLWAITVQWWVIVAANWMLCRVRGGHE